VGAVAVAVLFAACDDSPGAAACHGVCGEGTVCKDGKCVVAEAAPAPAPAVGDDAKTAGKRRKGAKRSGDAAPASGFTPVDDSHVAEFDGTKTQALGDGTERLDDSVVRAQLRKLEPAFNRCIETAAAQSDTEIRGGEVDFVFGIAPSGKVDGVTVKAPAHLRVFGIVPCMRSVLAGHRFPAFDGPAMGVDYSFQVG
jgi:hypothetical protein